MPQRYPAPTRRRARRNVAGHELAETSTQKIQRLKQTTISKPQKLEYHFSMTLVVARRNGDRIAVVADTLLTRSGARLPIQDGLIKSCLLPGQICVSFSNSPELASRDFVDFEQTYPNGTSDENTCAFFKKRSLDNGNDYLIAFNRPPKIVRVRDGSLDDTNSGTKWIGDKEAFERFREYEALKPINQEAGRAINTVLFMDELEGSPTSDLYSVMRNLVVDPNVSSVGGFISAISSRPDGFRFSAYNNMLFDWETDKDETYRIDRTDRVDYRSSGENTDAVTSQVCSNCLGLNIVSFYLLTAKKLFLFYSTLSGLANKCTVFNEVSPNDIEDTLKRFVGSDGLFDWLIFVASPAASELGSRRREPRDTTDGFGIGLAFFTHVNTFTKYGKLVRVMEPIGRAQ